MTDVRTVISVDPGSSKCGIAVVESPSLQVVHRDIVPTDRLVVEIGLQLRSNPSIETLIIGSGTRSRVLARALRDAFPDIPPLVVDEHGSSRRARQRYCREIPAKGWRKLLPEGMRSPEGPYDDWVAVLLAEDYLRAETHCPADTRLPASGHLPPETGG